MALIDRRLEEACRILAESEDQVIQAAGLTGQMRINALRKYGNGQKTTALLPTETKILWDRNTPFVKNVMKEMRTAEENRQWPLSTYGPWGCRPSYPNFRDHSAEEMRYLYYEALKKGNLATFEKHWQSLLDKALANMRSLQNPSQDAINILQQQSYNPFDSK